MSFLQSFDFTQIQWIWVIIAAFVIGFSKTGIGGIAMLLIPIMALYFGGKESTGILLPMLILGDIFAVKYYNRHANWRVVGKMLPWALIGIVTGVFVGSYVNDQQFKIMIAISIVICLFILVYTEIKGEAVKVPEKVWVYVITGIACGFASMIGNAAGPIFSIYLLAMGYRKNDFMGTTAWFFFIINVTKLPFQIFFWHNVSLHLTLLVIILIPLITTGAILGVYVIKRVKEKAFRYIILAMTVVAAIKLIIP